MKDFFKITLATIVGILVTGAVIVGFGIISLIGIWATSETETVVKNNSIYVLELKGIVSERSQENPHTAIIIPKAPIIWPVLPIN